MSFADNGTAIAVIAIVAVFLAIAGYAVSRLKSVGPDQVMYIISTGTKKGNNPSSNGTIAYPGKVLVLPVVQEAYTLSLKQRGVDLTIVGPDKNFIPVTVNANLKYKISDTDEGIRLAAQRFNKFNDDALDKSISDSVEGIVRSILASMDLQGINSNRPEFVDQVRSTAKTEMADQGIHIDILNIKDVKTSDVEYWASLNTPEKERAKLVAAEATSAAKLATDKARTAQEEQSSRIDADLKIKQAEFKAKTDTQEAIADAAKGIAQAERNLELARLQRVTLAEEALVKEQELDIAVKKPADAQAYARTKEAEGERDAAKSDAEADAYRTKTDAEAKKEAAIFEATGKAESQKLEASAEAAAIELKGEAEGKSITSIGTATAGAEEAKANALAKYTAEAITYIVAQSLPEIMAANAEAVKGIDNYTVISTDGASDATKQVTRMGTEGLASIEALLGGANLKGMLTGLVGGLAAGKTVETVAAVKPADEQVTAAA